MKTSESDTADARSICWAVQEPGMRFVGMTSGPADRASPPSGPESIPGQSHRPGELDPWDLAGIRRGHSQDRRLSSEHAALLLTEERWAALVWQFLSHQQAELKDWNNKIEVVTAQIKREHERKACALIDKDQ